MNPPLLEFNYIGAEITSSRVMASSTSSITLSLTTSKPATLWALFVSDTTRLPPSSSTIKSEGQVHSASHTTTHVLMMTDLKEDTKYTVFFAGEEETGTQLSLDVQATMMTVRTKSSSSPDLDSKSDGTQCKNGWAVDAESDSLVLLPCSHHGYCRQERCVCVEPYTGETCDTVEEVALDRTNATHRLIHVQLRLFGAFKESAQLAAYWRLSLRESGCGLVV